MKILKYISAFLVTILLHNACGTDDLELLNPNELSDDTFFKNEVQLQSAVDAIYANLQTRALYTRHMFFMNDNMSHESTPNPQHEADKREYYNFTFTGDHYSITKYWENCYRGLNKANFVIFNQDKFQNVSEDAVNRGIGEAKYMRAFYYFLLVTRFGGVPLNTEPTNTGNPRSSREETFALIISDLTDAASLLPSKDNTELGRATSGAAYALLGKAYLYTEQWQNAVDAFDNVTGYSLVPNYMDNFLEETEFNDESIFEVTYDISGNTGDKWGETGTGLNHVTFRGQEYGWNDWFNSYPSDELRAEFEAGDPRYSYNFYSNGDSYVGGTVAIPQERDAAWRKYQNYYKQESENQASGINMRVIRYADVLLMKAEAENNLGNTTEAISLLNEVRDRVGMANYGSAEMNASYPVTNQQEVFEAIVHERMVELAGEQVRFNDMVRWGIASDYFQSVGFSGFVEGQHEVFPIPNTEIELNENISLDDQNPGY